LDYVESFAARLRPRDRADGYLGFSTNSGLARFDGVAHLPEAPGFQAEH
jgi:hypothetical protein